MSSIVTSASEVERCLTRDVRVSMDPDFTLPCKYLPVKDTLI